MDVWCHAVPSGDRIMVDAVQTWTPRFWPTWLLHPPVRLAACLPNDVFLHRCNTCEFIEPDMPLPLQVWYQHVLMSTTDNPAGCAG